MKRKVCTTTVIAFLMLLVINVGTTKAGNMEYSLIEYSAVALAAIDGEWTTDDEWTNAPTTEMSDNANFGYNVYSNSWVMQWIVEIFDDDTNDTEDYWQICIDNNNTGGTTPQSGDYRVDIIGHTDLVFYEGNGQGWDEIIPDEGEILWANSIEGSPRDTTPHWILELAIDKTIRVAVSAPPTGMRVAYYDASNSEAGVQAWAPDSERDSPDEWGVISEYSEYPYTPGKVATPTFNPEPGNYTSAQLVTISCDTGGATIHYTTNGEDPTSTSPIYTDPISVSSDSVTIKARAFKSDMNDSYVATGTYTILPQQVATPTFNPEPDTYTSAQSVTIACDTGGAIIHYTTDGTDPTSTSPIYTNQILVSSGSVTIKARAFKSGMTGSTIAIATYTIQPPQQVATPTLNPTPDTYTSAQSVTISCSTSDSTIRYTTNGEDPTSSSPIYSSPISVTNGSVTIKARAFKSGMTGSNIVTGTYTILPQQVATPTFNPTPDTYTSAQSVTISCSTSDSTIRYTTNGEDPTSSSPIYSSPISVTSGSVTIKARAFRSNWTDSEIVTATYTIQPSNYMDWDFLQVILALLGIAVSVVLVAATYINSRRKRGQIKKLIDEIDDVFFRFQLNSRRCEAELYRLKDVILEQYKSGAINEGSYAILDERIDDYLSQLSHS